MIEESTDEVVLSVQSSVVKTSEGGNNHFQSTKLLSTDVKETVNSNGERVSMTSPATIKAFGEIDQDHNDSLATLSDYNIQIEMKQVLEMVEPIGNDLAG